MSDVDGSGTRRPPQPPGRVAPGRPPDALLIDPLHEPQRPLSATALNSLEDFSPEDPDTSARLGALLEEAAAETREAPVTPNPKAMTAAPIVEPTAADDLLELRRQTEVSLERAKHDAQAVARELNELRVTGTRLVQGFTSLDATCRLTEQRTERAAEVLGVIESRLEPLAAVRALTNNTDDRLASLRHLAEEVMQHAARFERERQSIERGLVSLTPAGELLAATEARLATFNARAEGLAQAQAAVEELERRAGGMTAALQARIVEMTGALDRRVTGFDAQKQVIEQALSDASRVTERVAALDAQVTALTAPGHTLAQAESRVRELQRHAADSIVALERHAAGTAAALEARIAELTCELDRRLSGFDAQKQAIELALAEASGVTAVVAALDARVATLTAPDHAFARAARAVQELEHRVTDATAALEGRAVEKTAAIERRAAEATAALERRADETAAAIERPAADTTSALDERGSTCDAHRHTTEDALAEAARAADLVSALNAPVATLSASDRVLAPTLTVIDHVEHRAAAALQREHLAQEQDQLEAAVAAPQAELAMSSESAAGQPGAASPSRKAPALAWRARITGTAGTSRSPFRALATGLAALTVLLLAGIVMRAPDLPAATQVTAVRDRLPQAVPTPPAPLPPDAASIETSVPTAPRAAAPITAAIPTPPPDAAIQLPPRQPPARAVKVRRSAAAPPAQPAQTPFSTAPPVVAAKNTGDPFVGALAVESAPAGAAVFIDQQYVGATPLDLTRIRAGSHAIRIDHEGYARWTASVLVPAGKRTRVSTMLQPVGPFSTGGDSR